MKFRNYTKDTFKICMNYVRDPKSAKARMQLEAILQRWVRSKGFMQPYDYSNCDVIGTIEYCSDRMNKGRAIAIMEVINEREALEWEEKI